MTSVTHLLDAARTNGLHLVENISDLVQPTGVATLYGYFSRSTLAKKRILVYDCIVAQSANNKTKLLRWWCVDRHHDFDHLINVRWARIRLFIPRYQQCGTSFCRFSVRHSYCLIVSTASLIWIQKLCSHRFFNFRMYAFPPMPFLHFPSATKFAVNASTKGLRHELMLQKSSVRVSLSVGDLWKSLMWFIYD